MFEIEQKKSATGPLQRHHHHHARGVGCWASIFLAEASSRAYIWHWQYGRRGWPDQLRSMLRWAAPYQTDETERSLRQKPAFGNCSYELRLMRSSIMYIQQASSWLLPASSRLWVSNIPQIDHRWFVETKFSIANSLLLLTINGEERRGSVFPQMRWFI